MKKLILFIIVCLLLCSCENVENVEYQSTNLDEILEVLSNNTVRFEEIYNRKHVTFFGEVYHISDSEIGISAVGNGTASCRIKKKAVKEKLSDLNSGDYIKVYGKCKSFLH